MLGRSNLAPWAPMTSSGGTMSITEVKKETGVTGGGSTGRSGPAISSKEGAVEEVRRLLESDFGKSAFASAPPGALRTVLGGGSSFVVILNDPSTSGASYSFTVDRSSG